MSEPVNVDALRALAELATPGPWTAQDTTIERDFHGFGCGWTVGGLGHYGFTEANARFVAAANPVTVLALLDENATLTSKLGEAWRERDALHAERDRLLALKVSDDGAYQHVAEMCNEQIEDIRKLTVERDEARAERDALKALLRRASPSIEVLRDMTTNGPVIDACEAWMAEAKEALR